ncbi:MAG: sensor histidine kinase [Flavobacteriaceae bacterium]
MKPFLITAIFLISFYSLAQSVPREIDSLMQVAKTANDSVKLRIYNKVSFYYIFNNPSKAKELLLKGITLSQKNKNFFSEAELTNTYGIYFDVSGKSDSAKYFFEKAYTLSKDHQHSIIEVMVINNLGMFHWNKGQYQEALDYFFQSLAMDEKMSGSNKTDTYLNNIGLIYQEMGLYDKALEYHNKALTIRRELKKISDIPVSLNNLAISLTEKRNYQEAEATLNECLQLAKQANEKGVYCSCLNSLSNIYISTQRIKEAIPILEESIEIREKFNIDRRANLSSIANLIEAYNEIGTPKKALPYIEAGIKFLDEFPDLKIAAVDFYANTTNTYFQLNEVDKGTAYFKLTLKSKDSIFSLQNAENLATLETQYETEKTAHDLAKTRASLAEKELEVERKNGLLYGSVGLAIILGLIGYLFYKQQRLKNRQLTREAELKTALTKIETQNKLQEQRLRISRDLHDNIGSQLTFVTSSIDNLKYGLGDKNSNVSEKLGNISEFTTQTIYELRDTIWAMNKEEISLEDLQARISNFIEKAGSANGQMRFSFEIASTISNELLLPSIVGMNIYRIIQEGVNNALKYAVAKTIIVRISEKNNQYQLSIIDDGKGFDITKVELGNGLNNIKKRTKDIGGEVTIGSKPTEGTTITVTFPKG